MVAYLPVIVPFCIGMTVFGLLRRRDTDPLLSGIAAIGVSMILVVAYFAVLLKTGRV